MLRTFPQHHIRYTQSLDGVWEFVTADDASLNPAGLPKRYNRKTVVPVAWETIPGLETYRGKAWFKRTIEAIPGMATRLVFGGVSHTADVFVDGEKLAHHYDAFTPFEVIIPADDKTKHELIVEVDNTFGDHSALHFENDYYTYGGITRPVELQFLDSIYISDLKVTTDSKTFKTWDLNVAVTVQNQDTTNVEALVEYVFQGKHHELGEVVLKPGQSKTLTDTLKLNNVKAWTDKTPNLYTVTAQLVDIYGTIGDDLATRTGFRKLQVKGKKLLLNGKPLHLYGFNRHEDHPQFGCALPMQAIASDLQLLQDTGANFLRTCHYPNDMRVLDMCDELGIYVWEEHHARSIDFDHPSYKEQINSSTQEMVQWHFNHPSIVMWGCLNECKSYTPAGAKEHGRILNMLKKLDPSRPTTYASMFHEKDLAYKYADIVSWNRYCNWYGNNDPDVGVKAMLKWLHGSEKTGGKGKPVILSEFGAGAIYGYRHPKAERWTEEYQVIAIEQCLNSYLNHPDIIGSAIWQFCDVRTTQFGIDQCGPWKTRPRCNNNKGIVDEYRRPKLAYAKVKELFTKAAKQKRK